MIRLMKRIALVSLGCPKNLVDSEYICERFIKADYNLVQNLEDADLVVVNTCSFLTSAVEESVNTLLDLVKSGKEVLCTGCLVSRYGHEIAKELPEIRLFAGPGSYEGIVDAYESGRKYLEPSFDSVVKRSFFSGTASAYVKVSEGCDNRCNYCLIPSIRGRLVSKSVEEVVAECLDLAGSGAKEIILVAQDLGGYGKDLALKDGLNMTYREDIRHRCRRVDPPHVHPSGIAHQGPDETVRQQPQGVPVYRPAHPACLRYGS